MNVVMYLLGSVLSIIIDIKGESVLMYITQDSVQETAFEKGNTKANVSCIILGGP